LVEIPMRYMFLIYSRGDDEPLPADEDMATRLAHRAVMDDARARGIFQGAEPLAPAATATTVRHQQGGVLITDGPFAETKEQLAGYYILECRDLDEALEWAARIPTNCRGGAGCIEVRPLLGMQAAAAPINAATSD
jgi:hypothetical protein